MKIKYWENLTHLIWRKGKYWILSIPHTAPPKIINEGYFSKNKKKGLLISSLDVWMLGMRWHTIVHLCIFHMGHKNSCHALAWPPLLYLTFVFKKRISGTVKDWWQSLAKRDTGTYTFKKAVFWKKNKIRELPETKPPSRQCNHKAYPRCRCHSSQRESSRACVITIYGITHMATLCWYVVVKTHCVCVQVVPFEKIEARPLLEYDGCLVNPSVKAMICTHF